MEVRKLEIRQNSRDQIPAPQNDLAFVIDAHTNHNGNVIRGMKLIRKAQLSNLVLLLLGERVSNMDKRHCRSHHDAIDSRIQARLLVTVTRPLIRPVDPFLRMALKHIAQTIFSQTTKCCLAVAIEIPANQKVRAWPRFGVLCNTCAFAVVLQRTRDLLLTLPLCVLRGPALQVHTPYNKRLRLFC